MWPFTKKKKIPQLWEVLTKPLIEGDYTDRNIVSRVMKKNPEWSDRKIDSLINEYKKFLYICAKCDEEQTPSKEVDEIWHEHILFTKEYEKWCDFLGKKIHHNPEKVGETKSFHGIFEETQKKMKELKKPEKTVKPSPVKKVSAKPIKRSSSSSRSSVSSSPSISDGFVENMILHQTLFGNSSYDSGCSPSSDSSPSSSSSSSSSCSSSSCSSSSCSSSSCGGGGD